MRIKRLVQAWRRRDIRVCPHCGYRGSDWPDSGECPSCGEIS
ncbi:DNA repair protein RadA [Olsenella sp. An188]|nr:DNA repair protein RadA [Olsenella sp. An188]